MFSVILSVSSVEASTAFYADKLGFHADPSLPGPDGKPVFGGVSGHGAMVMFDSVPWAGYPTRGGTFALYVQLPKDADIDSFYADVKGKGVTFTEEIHDAFWGERVFTVKDPDGYLISFAKPVKEVSFEDMAAFTRQAQPQG